MSAIGPGDIVECVDVRPREWADGADYLHQIAIRRLALGAIYTVQSIEWSETEVGLHLKEISGAVGRDPGVGYAIDRFRPIYRPKSELLESLLRKADEPILGAV